MELTFAQQSAAFALSIVMGLGLGLLYGLLKFLRFLFSPARVAVFVLDVLFMLVWALGGFLFSLAYLRGYVRLYVFAGSLLGFLAYRLTLGRLLCRIYQPVVGLLKKVSQKIFEKLKLFAAYLLKIACKILYNIASGIECLRETNKRKIQSYSEKRKIYESKKTKYQKGFGFFCRRKRRKKRPAGR